MSERIGESSGGFEHSGEPEEELMRKVEEVGTRWEKEPPSPVELLFKRFRFLMVWLEAHSNVDVKTAQVPLVGQMYVLGDDQKLKKVNTPTVKEALQVGIEQVEKNLNLIPEDAQGEARNLLTRARIYLADAS